MKSCHVKCFEDCEVVLELEKKTATKVKKETDRLEKKRLDDAKKVRKEILESLDTNDPEEASSGAEKKMDEFVEERLVRDSEELN